MADAQVALKLPASPADYKLLFDTWRKLSEAERGQLYRWYCRHDLYFLLRYMLRRERLEHPWLFARCREVQAAPNGYIDLWPRFHYKSSIITFGLSIQDILRDTETTIGIFSHTRPIAKAFLRQIKVEFETNGPLKDLFPDVLWADPKKQALKWSEDDGIVVKRKGNPPESTVEAWGLVDAQPTGKHFRVQLYDDVVVKESVGTPEMIAKTTGAWELSLALRDEAKFVRRTIGTRYHQLDTYAEMMRRGVVVPRVHKVTVDGTETGTPVFMSQQELADIRKDWGPWTFGSQMLLDPAADKVQGFKKEWLRFLDVEERWRGMNRYILVDPAGSKGKDNDYTVFVVIGLASDHRYYTTWIYRDRLNLTERTKMLFKLHRKYRPLKVGYEEYGMQADIEHVKFVQELETYDFEIVALGGQMEKNTRIRRLVPIFEQGRMFLPRACEYINSEGRMVDSVKAFVDEEYSEFPVASHDDIFDAMARIVDEDLDVTWPAMPVLDEKPAWMKELAEDMADEGGGFMSR